MNLNELYIFYAKLMFSGDDRNRLYKKVGKLLENGVPIIHALNSIRDRRLKHTSKGDGLVMALNEWIVEMENGASFADAATGWIPAQETMLLMAGERSGNMSGAFRSAVSVMDTIKKIKSAVISGLMYPLVVGLMGFIVAWMFGAKIFPAFFKIAPEDRWQGLAQQAITFSHFIQNDMYLVGIAVAFILVIIVWSLPRFDGALRIRLDKFPPYSIYRIVVGSTWLIALAAMVDAGERIEDALIKTKVGSSIWLNNRIDACLIGMREGHTMGEALARSGYNFPDEEIIDDLGVYSSIAGFNDALSMLGNEWAKESVAQVEVGMKVLFVVGIFAVATLLAFLISGLLSMELQLSSVINH